MIKNRDVQSLLSDLESDNIETVILTMESAAEFVQTIIKNSVTLLDNSEVDFLVAERLHRFGKSAIEPLEEYYKNTTSDSGKILASLVLLQLGSKLGENFLLNVGMLDKNMVCLVAQHLSHNHTQGLDEKIINYLRSINPRELKQFGSETIIPTCLLDILKEIGGTLPEDLYRLYTLPEIAIEIKTNAEKLR